jgi:hypothetical protein
MDIEDLRDLARRQATAISVLQFVDAETSEGKRHKEELLQKLKLKEKQVAPPRSR